MDHERYAEKLIEDALVSGELDPLEGVGRPLPYLDNDPDWWVKSFLHREKIPDRHAEVDATRQALLTRAIAADDLGEARRLLVEANRTALAWNEEAPEPYRFDEVSEVWLIGQRAGRPAD